MSSICRTFPCIWLLQNLLSGIQRMLLYGVWNKTCFVLVCFSNCLQCMATVGESSSLAIPHGNYSLWPQLKFVSLSPKYISCPLAGNFENFWTILKHSEAQEGQRESMKPSLYFPLFPYHSVTAPGTNEAAMTCGQNVTSEAATALHFKSYSSHVYFTQW